MTWGLLDPYGAGDYLPSVRMMDFETKIDHHFSNVMTDAERSEFDNWSVNLEHSVSKKFVYDRGRLSSFEQPEVIKFFKTPKNLASLIKLTDGLLAVDEQFKSIIEDLEPDVHQFWPLDFQLPRGKGIGRPYYAMVIHYHLDAFVPEESDEDAWRSGNGFYHARIGTDKQTVNGLAILSSAVAGHHLWRDTKLSCPEVFMSDALKERVDASNLRIFKHYKVRDV